MRPLKTSLAALGAWIVLAGTTNAAPAADCTVNIKPGANAKAQTLAQDMAKTNPCTLVPGLTPKSLSSVWSAMLSSNKTGGKRFDTPPPAGLPAGRVMLAASGLVFNLQAVLGEGVLSLQLSDSGSTAALFSVANPAQAVVVVAAGRLKLGASYEWRLSTRKASYKGSFELLDAEDAAAVQSRLTALAAADLSPQLRLLYLAAIYDEAELYSARDLTLDEVRRLLAP